MRTTIIGAGFSGSSLAIQLAAQLPAGHDVCLVGDSESFGRGAAYGLARPEHLLNVRASDLGPDPAHPDEFAESLELADGSRNGFLPRDVYGEFLAQRLETAIADSGGRLHPVRDKVIGLRRLPGGFRVHLADGGDFFSDRVVLAVGALPPRALPEVDTRLAQDSRYVGRVWHPDSLAGIDPDARVLIVGTGLTMADVLVSLRRQGHRGVITAVSRHGLLPQAHLDRPQPAVLPPALARAVENADLRQLVRLLRGMAAVGGDWRPLVDGLRPHNQSLWQRLPTAQRRRFLRHLRAHWEVHRHRIAPALARKLQQELASGGLVVRAAKLLHARLERNGVRALLRPRGQERAAPEEFDVIVRATGFDTDVQNTHHALIAHLREADLVAPDELGLGLRSDPAGQVVDRHGGIVPGLFLLGPLQRGQLWEVTAIAELRNAAAALARKLAEPVEDASQPAVHVSMFEPLHRHA